MDIYLRSRETQIQHDLMSRSAVNPSSYASVGSLFEIGGIRCQAATNATNVQFLEKWDVCFMIGSLALNT